MISIFIFVKDVPRLLFLYAILYSSVYDGIQFLYESQQFEYISVGGWIFDIVCCRLLEDQ